MIDFTRIKAFLIDLDGTVYFKGAPILGAVETITFLRNKGFSLRFLTNTDSKTSRTLFKRLNGMDITNIPESEIFNPPRMLVRFFEQHPGKSAFFIVSEEIQDLFIDVPRTGCPDYVVVGDVQEYSDLYEKLNQAFRYLKQGSKLIALQTSLYYHSKDGYNLDTGSFVHLLEHVTGQKSLVIGKPSTEFFKLVLDELQLNGEEVAVVGDFIDSDIVGGHNINAKTILVKT
ncbi:MAG: HAD-IIA family hydrolase, partial [Candidatus Odinarchaeota archaeon]